MPRVKARTARLASCPCLRRRPDPGASSPAFAEATASAWSYWLRIVSGSGSDDERVAAARPDRAWATRWSERASAPELGQGVNLPHPQLGDPGQVARGLA